MVSLGKCRWIVLEFPRIDNHISQASTKFVSVFNKFYDVDNNNDRKQTQVVDKIDFELRYGRIGRLFDGFVYRSLQKLFCHRKIATIRALENNI
jgi:hypothetical protein